ncbi:helix-turn-helix domain-containing protein [Pantanalinema rosaneae CENA516]|uniref:helix-turn-helix domain-containing protein n=1 Tax=Pantanalinema rosaneae TaxID=1620701 RepID=UPI003D6F5573
MKNQVLQMNIGQVETLTELGERLRQFRQKQELSLEYVAGATMIPVRLLTAIEEGDLSRLPEPVYIQGFIRRYADAIGMDGLEFASAFPTQATHRVVRHSWRGAVGAQLRPLHLYLIYMALVIGAVSGLSYLLNRSTPQPVQYNLSQNLNPPSAPNPAIVVPKAGTPASVPSGAAAVSQSPQIASALKESDKPIRVGLTLTDQSWIRVVADGKMEFEGVLPQGSQRIWSANQELTVRAGNAGGVIVTLNENSPKPMGVPGAVEEMTFGSGSDARTVTSAPLSADPT